MTYPEDYGQPPRDPRQGAVTQQQAWGPQPPEQPNRQQPYGQPWPPQNQPGAFQPPSWQPPVVPPQKRKSWPARHKVLTALTACGALIVVIIAVASSSNDPSPAASATPAGNSASHSAAASSAAASVAASTPAAAAGPSLTAAQQQAVDSARDYLSEGNGFSERGLLDQLTSSYGEGFSKPDAEFAIKYLEPNWAQQAVDSAKSYLSEGSGFSERGLLEQLTSSSGEGFTQRQAEQAINGLHPDWDAQAVDSAKGYLSDGQGFSRSSLTEQLESSYGSGFTDAQAEYAVNKVMG